MLDEHNAVLRDKILVRRLLKTEALFPEWLQSRISKSLLSKDQVIKVIGEENWEGFAKFMAGQTVALGADDKSAFYECDVNNFMNKINGRPVFFD